MLKYSIEVVERKHKAFDISLAHRDRDKPHGISGMMRLRNDMDFTEESIVSHLPWLDELVIILQPSEDETEDLAYTLEQRYEKVRVAFYPFKIVWTPDPLFATTSERSIYSTVHMTNWGLSQCEYSWIAPIEGDCISLPSFASIRDRIDLHPNKPQYYGRTCLNLAGKRQDMISHTAPHNAGWDVPVMPNNADWYSFKYFDKWASYNMGEHMGEMVPMGWQFIHMQRCKVKNYEGYPHEKWVPFTKAYFDVAMKDYRVPFMGPRDDQLLYDWRDENVSG